MQIYTPKVSKKRTNVRRFEDDEYVDDSSDENQPRDMSKNETQKSSTSKIWSFVSTFLRFASLTPASDLSLPDIKDNDNESRVIIKRCTSFTGARFFFFLFFINSEMVDSLFFD